MDGLGWLLLSLVFAVFAFISYNHRKQDRGPHKDIYKTDTHTSAPIETTQSKDPIRNSEEVTNELKIREVEAENHYAAPAVQTRKQGPAKKGNDKKVIKFKYSTDGNPEIKNQFECEPIQPISLINANSQQKELIKKWEDYCERVSNGELRCSVTDLCLCNEDETDIEIVTIPFDSKIEYSKLEHKGLFRLIFPQGEAIEIPNATHFWKFYNGGNGIIYHYKDLYNIIFFIWQVQGNSQNFQYGNSLHTLYIYKGPHLIDKIEGVYSSIDTSKSIGRFCFYRPLADSMDEDNCEQYLYNFGEKILLARGKRRIYSTGHWAEPSLNSLKLYKSLKNKGEYDITGEDDYIKIFFFVNGCKASYVLREFCKTADEYKKLPNPFPDDATENYMAKFKKSRVEDIQFVQFCFMRQLFGMRPSFAGYGLYFTSVEDFSQCIIDYKHPIDSDFWKLTDDEYNSGVEMLKDLYKYSSHRYSDNHFPPDMPYLYITSKIQMMYLQKISNELSKEKLDLFKEKYNQIYMRLLEDGVVKGKWQSEYNLFQLLEKMYPDAIYQYHASWLGMQSLDIYVPSIRTGFEYQGEQHYHPVEIFGGEESFKKNVERDKRKKALCKQNDIHLVEVRYDEPVTANRIKQKIQEIQQ